ncbi:hypothetical protein C8P64_0114 [Christiangramia gaetbulicola]|uniref:DUF1684 domain-containing protein n=1 Tax=Christiangramia gaetbulicola TaxID=703340 RepID=A0A2T6AK12_9FLAO|nr:DUF1684 domain-containing protein [Christiangramia gaetbulicola]PTX44144.1 hypothetical protein C8P64_0114 [Christiangramia gaetbulicola]
MSAYIYFFSLLVMILSPVSSMGQDAELLESAKEFQEELDREYADPDLSPLDEKDREVFKGLEFFEIDPEYIVQAEFVRTPSESPFAMPTSSEKMKTYVKYGELYFTLKGQDLKLNLYQSQDLVNDPEYFDYLFLPFTDPTNGKSTYGGGRYIDFRIPESNIVTLDFNKAYNPYCAYSGNYSCPIPPKENDLPVEITAGVKAFDKH